MKSVIMDKYRFLGPLLEERPVLVRVRVPKRKAEDVEGDAQCGGEPARFFSLPTQPKNFSVLCIGSDVWTYCIGSMSSWDDCIALSLVSKAFYSMMQPALNRKAKDEFVAVADYHMTRFGSTVLSDPAVCRRAYIFLRHVKSTIGVEMTANTGIHNFGICLKDIRSTFQLKQTRSNHYSTNDLFAVALMRFGTVDNILLHALKAKQKLSKSREKTRKARERYNRIYNRISDEDQAIMDRRRDMLEVALIENGYDSIESVADSLPADDLHAFLYDPHDTNVSEELVVNSFMIALIRKSIDNNMMI